MVYTNADLDKILVLMSCCYGDKVYEAIALEKKGRTKDAECLWRKIKFLFMSIRTLKGWYLPQTAVNATFQITIDTVVGGAESAQVSFGATIVGTGAGVGITAAQIATALNTNINSLTGVNGGFTSTVSGTTVTIIAPLSLGDFTGTPTITVVNLTTSQNSAFSGFLPQIFAPNNCLTEAKMEVILQRMSGICGCCNCLTGSDITNDSVYIAPGTRFNPILN
jgi:hypothetical protein